MTITLTCGSFRNSRNFAASLLKLPYRQSHYVDATQQRGRRLAIFRNPHGPIQFRGPRKCISNKSCSRSDNLRFAVLAFRRTAPATFPASGCNLPSTPRCPRFPRRCSAISAHLDLPARANPLKAASRCQKRKCPAPTAS